MSRGWANVALLGLIVGVPVIACTLNPQPLPPGEVPQDASANVPTGGNAGDDDDGPGNTSDSGALSPPSTDAGASASDSGARDGGTGAGGDAAIDSGPAKGDSGVGDASDAGGDGGDAGDAAVDAQGDALSGGD